MLRMYRKCFMNRCQCGAAREQRAPETRGLPVGKVNGDGMSMHRHCQMLAG